MSGLPLNEIKKLLENLREGEGNKKIFTSLLLTVVLFCLFVFTSFIFSEYNFFQFAVMVKIINGLGAIGFTESIAKGLIVVGTATIQILITLCILNIKDWFIDNVFLHRGYLWNPNNGLADWEFQGNILVDKSKKVMHIIQSDLGCIIKHRSWDNFQLKFRFKVPANAKFSPSPNENQWERGFGILFRAKKLGQYYMLKIDKDGYHPHVRPILWENNGPIAKITLAQEDLDLWISVKLSIANEFLEAKIGNDIIEYTLPSYSNAHREAKIPSEYAKSLESVPFAKIPYQHGSIGFRSAFFEEVYIKNIQVTTDSMVNRLTREFWKIIKVIIYI